MTAAPLLEVSELSVAYGRGPDVPRALADADLTIAPGETVGLVGESGSGKSTLARAVLGLAPVRSGSIRFDGNEITRLGGAARRRLARELQIVFQDPYSSLNPSRTIGRSVAEPLQAAGERDRATVRRRVAEMLELVHLPPDAAGALPRDFSGGQRQRVAIARALIVEPRLVICDEATSALDLSIQAQIVNLLRERQRASGLSYLFISHDLELVRNICDRVVVLYRGRVMETGTAQRIATAPAHPYTHAVHASVPVPDPRLQRARREQATSVDVDIPAPSPEASSCPFAPRCPHARARCTEERPELRPAPEDGRVACHRYPEWLDEIEAATEATSGDRARTRERWLTPPARSGDEHA